jgi:hypothetical protein
MTSRRGLRDLLCLGFVFVVMFAGHEAVAAESQMPELSSVPAEVATKLRSNNIGDLLETLDEIWRGKTAYRAAIGDFLVARYHRDVPNQVRPMILSVLHKYRHPEVFHLLSEAKSKARPGELEVLKCIEADLDPKDPSIPMRVLQMNLQHIDTLTMHELEQITYALYTLPDKFKYDVRVGDALSKRYPELTKGEESYHARYWILKVLHTYDHPAFPALLKKLESSDDPNERKWATEFGSSPKVSKPPPNQN